MKCFLLYILSVNMPFPNVYFLSPGETKPAVWKPSATSSLELGDVRSSYLPYSPSLMINMELVGEQ